MTQATPGLRRLDPSRTTDTDRRYYEVVGANDLETVAIVEDGPNDARVAANARLIAAAPELRDELRSALWCLRKAFAV